MSLRQSPSHCKAAAGLMHLSAACWPAAGPRDETSVTPTTAEFLDRSQSAPPESLIAHRIAVASHRTATAHSQTWPPPPTQRPLTQHSSQHWRRARHRVSVENSNSSINSSASCDATPSCCRRRRQSNRCSRLHSNTSNWQRRQQKRRRSRRRRRRQQRRQQTKRRQRRLQLRLHRRRLIRLPAAALHR